MRCCEPFSAPFDNQIAIQAGHALPRHPRPVLIDHIVAHAFSLFRNNDSMPDSSVDLAKIASSSSDGGLKGMLSGLMDNKSALSAFSLMVVTDLVDS